MCACACVIDSGTPRLKHSSVHDSVSSNKRHRDTTRLFSVITQKSLFILGAPNLDVNAIGDRKASFTLTCGCITWMNKKREMIGSETSPRLKSLTMSLFQPRTHTPFLTGQFSNVEVQLHGWSHTQCIIQSTQGPICHSGGLITGEHPL